MVTKHYRSRMLYIHTRWFTLVANTEQWSNLAIVENYSSRFLEINLPALGNNPGHGR
jgi:hypothetical protein